MSAASGPLGSDPPPLALTEEDVRRLADDLVAYHGQFADRFFRREQSGWALKYLQGLMLPGVGKSIEGVALSVQGGKVRSLQIFIGRGAWEDGPILERHRELVGESLGDPAGVLIVDGSEFPKKGAYSVGVARQYCGVRGKVENCQAGVFLAYASRRGHTLLDGRLYLPKEWFAADSQERWQRCGIPQGTPFRTKPQLAWEMVQGAHDSGAVPFSWVVCDEVFGDNCQFLERLEGAEIAYLADVSVTTRVWLERPETQIPAARGPRGAPSRRRVVPGVPEPVAVGELAAQLPKRAWRTYRVKEGEKGPIEAQFAFVRAVAVRDKLPGPHVWVLVRRSVSEPAEMKVFLSNASADTPRRELARVSGMRWPIETCFQEAKGSLGMAEYQTRSWRGWHHHMTLVMLAHHFLVWIKRKHKKGLRRSRSGKSAFC